MNRKLPSLALSTLCAALLLAGCSIGPDYQRPAMSIPASYLESGRWKPAEPLDAAPRGEWWTVYGDARLNQLMQRLDKNNPTLAQAEAQYRQTEALLRQAQSGLFPTLGATAGVTRSAAPGESPATQHSIALSSSWEVDLWGSVRRAVESGQAQLAASDAQREAIRLSTRAQLASSYLQLVVADQQLAQLRDSASALEQLLKLTRNQQRAGLVGDSEVARAESQWLAARAQLTDKQLQRNQLEHAIATSVGELPSNFTLPATKQLPQLPAIPAGLPSTLLERRPDIANAERRVAAANANIGIAQAAYFPTLTLSASGGYRSSSFADWISLPHRFWSLGPELAAAVFDGGLRRARTDQARANYDEAVASYRQTVLSAFQSVEDLLAAQAALAEQASQLQGALDAARRAERIANNSYRAGTISFLEVLTAQNSRIAAENALWTVRNRQYVSSVALIGALGGKW